MNLFVIVVVIIDKCYDNCEWVWGYCEIDVFGGYDLYSVFKVCVELVVVSYWCVFFVNGLLLVIGCVGNVIGGGDWLEDWFIFDVECVMCIGMLLVICLLCVMWLWQYVLDCLYGYLVFV